MEKIYKKPLEKKKKISIDLNDECLQVIDELAKLTKNSRTVIIEALIFRGTFPFLEYLEKSWKKFLDEGKYKKIEEEIKGLIKDLKKIKSKHTWLNPDYYWEALLSKKTLDKETKKNITDFLQDINLVPTNKKKYLRSKT